MRRRLVALAPDVIVANGDSAMGPLQQATRTIPIVFVNVSDPVGAGFVASLAQPGGNVTGFTAFEEYMRLPICPECMLVRTYYITPQSMPHGMQKYGVRFSDGQEL